VLPGYNSWTSFCTFLSQAWYAYTSVCACTHMATAGLSRKTILFCSKEGWNANISIFGNIVIACWIFQNDVLRVFQNFYVCHAFFPDIIILIFYRKVEKSCKVLPCCMYVHTVSFSTFEPVCNWWMPCFVISVLSNNSMAAWMCEVGAALVLFTCGCWNGAW